MKISYKIHFIVVVIGLWFGSIFNINAQTDEKALPIDSETAWKATVDTLFDKVPLLTVPAPSFALSPMTWAGAWNLHHGLNAQVGMSLSVGLGQNRLRDVGFGQTAALAYALPLGKRWFGAAGLYAGNMDWGSYHSTDVGIGAMVAYQANEKLWLYGYATKQLNELALSPHLCPLQFVPQGDRMGLGMDLKLSEYASIQINVEAASNTEPWHSKYLDRHSRVTPRTSAR